MGEKINQGNLYFRKKEKWFTELLYKTIIPKNGQNKEDILK